MTIVSDIRVEIINNVACIEIDRVFPQVDASGAVACFSPPTTERLLIQAQGAKIIVTKPV